MTRLFLLEDDEALAEALAWALEKNDFAVTRTATLAEARKLLAGGEFALLVLDVGLPDGSGFGLCRELRAAGSAVPILFLTAADEEVSIIRGLDGGGDDYMTKPFQLGELCTGPLGGWLTVTDDGPGIPARDIHHIFKRFYRGSAPRGEGLGLGLPFARTVLEAQGGGLQAESEEGRGAVFTAFLPAAPPGGQLSTS